MKQCNGKIYYYLPVKHQYSHWHMHKAEECNTYKKMKKKDQEGADLSFSESNQVIVHQEKLNKGMATLLSSGDFDTDYLTTTLATTMAGLE